MTDTLVYPNIRLGVEIEVEGAYDVREITGWRREGDGSLRDGGLELVFSQPKRGPAAQTAIRRAINELVRARARTSYRTSIHVHCDVESAQLRTKGLIRAIALYILLERALFAWEGNNRECNNFCVPMYKASTVLSDFARIVQMPPELRRDEMSTFESSRYNALNLHALYKFGTLEFRHMLTDFNYSRVITWINLVTSIMGAAARLRIKMPAFAKWITEASETEIMEEIYSPELVEAVGRATLADSIEQGRGLAISFLIDTGMLESKTLPPPPVAREDKFFNPYTSGKSHPLVANLIEKLNLTII